jgi:small subunit ribosomal protein S14
MAKKGKIESNKKRMRLARKYARKRAELLAIARDRSRPIEERFEAQLKLAKLPRNSAPVRIRNRCEITGRPRGYYRKFRISRIALREMANRGLIPGMTKASW